ncbi:MAG: hypothetical protein QM570_11640 [Planctomycetota bacterium]|nr:hypothetical protein [Planctomycetota bacterium]
MKRRRVLYIVAGGLLALPLACVLHVWYVFGRLAADEDRALRQLFFHTDYPAFLEACRELSARQASGELEPGRYAAEPVDVGRWLELPDVITQFNPSSIDIHTQGRVSINLGHFLSRRGVTAYRENHEPRSTGFKHGERELIPGLWYFDPDYALNAKYRKRMDALIDESERQRAGF